MSAASAAAFFAALAARAAARASSPSPVNADADADGSADLGAADAEEERQALASRRPPPFMLREADPREMPTADVGELPFVWADVSMPQRVCCDACASYAPLDSFKGLCGDTDGVRAGGIAWGNTERACSAWRPLKS